MDDFPGGSDLAAMEDRLGNARAGLEEAARAAAGFERETVRAFQHVREEQERAARAGDGFGRALLGAFEDAAVKGRGLSDVLKNLALDLAKLALNETFSALGASLAGGLQGGAGAGAFSSLLTGPRFAKGGVLSAPALLALQGGVGLAGEAGPEAIMPLRRGPDGRLGVAAEGGGAANITVNIQTADIRSFQKAEGQIAAMLNRMTARGARNL